MGLHVLLIVNGPFREEVIKEHGDFSSLVLNAAQRSVSDPEVIEGITFDQLHAYADDCKLPDTLDAYDAIIMSGSRYMVTDKAPWSERTAQWLARMVRGMTPGDTPLSSPLKAESGRADLCVTPMLGICYGHQLLAHALGGLVDWNPRGNQAGTHPVRRSTVKLCCDCENIRQSDPLMRKIGPVDSFLVQAWHKQSVVKSPVEGIPLFETHLDPYHMLRLGPYIYSTQYHPEFTPALFKTYSPLLAFDSEEDREKFKESLKDTPIGTRILGAFLELAYELKTQRESAFASRKEDEKKRSEASAVAAAVTDDKIQKAAAAQQ